MGASLWHLAFDAEPSWAVCIWMGYLMIGIEPPGLPGLAESLVDKLIIRWRPGAGNP